MRPRQRPSRSATTAAGVFGRILCHLREQHGYSQDELAKLIPCDRSLVTRVEAGDRVPQQAFAAQCDLVLDTGGLLTRLRREIDWYNPSTEMPDWFRRRAAMDAVATAVMVFQLTLVPGLLQTRDYARALFLRSAAGEEERLIEERVSARLSRQERFLAPDGPLLSVILDEGALRRVVGGPAVMRGQLDHLLAVGELPNVRIQVAPYTCLAGVPADASTTLLTMPDGHEWVYSESLNRGHLSDDPSVISANRRIHALAQADALSARDSAAWMSDAREGHGNHDHHPRPEQGPLAKELPLRGQRRRLHRGGPHPARRRRRT
jgi:transcriptional regulator with XRE-family HTH domain